MKKYYRITVIANTVKIVKAESEEEALELVNDEISFGDLEMDEMSSREIPLNEVADYIPHTGGVLERED